MIGDTPPFPQYVFMAWCLVKRKAQGTMKIRKRWWKTYFCLLYI